MTVPREVIDRERAAGGARRGVSSSSGLKVADEGAAGECA